MAGRDQTTADQVRIRSYRPMDRAAVLRLNRTGVVGDGSPADRGTDDLDSMETSYFGQPQDHFWVAEVDGRLVGMIGLIERHPHVAVIRRLRVAARWQGTDVCPRLVKAALWHSWVHGAVKIVIDGPCTAERAIQFLSEIGFQCSRSRTTEGHELIEVYPTLYARPPYEVSGPCEREVS